MRSVERFIYELSYWEIVDILCLLGGKATLHQIKNFCKRMLGESYVIHVRTVKLVNVAHSGWMNIYIAYVKYHDSEYPVPIFDFYLELNNEKYNEKVIRKGYRTMFERIEKEDYKTKVEVILYSAYAKNKPLVIERANLILTKPTTPEPKATILFKIPINGHELTSLNSFLTKKRIENAINEMLYNPEHVPSEEYYQ